MKKIIIGIICLLILCGCGKINEENIIKEYSDKLSKSSSYSYSGSMQIISNEEKFDYKIDVSYLKDDFYKVVLINQNNNHEQIILRNEDGVYVVTPSLNKSFKFQSEWPDNSSQAYILSSLLKDLKGDNDVLYEKQDNVYVLKTKVNYPNNSTLKYEKIYFDKNVNPLKVEVYNNDDNIVMVVNLGKIHYNAHLSKKDFALDSFIDEKCCDKSEENCKNTCLNSCDGDNCTKESSSLQDAIYPLYVPVNSSLTSSEKIETETGNRLILSFAGDNDFVLVEETSSAARDWEIIPVYGDPYMMSSSIAAVGANSIYWTDNNVDFYLASNELSSEEMLTIAQSMVTSQVVYQSK